MFRIPLLIIFILISSHSFSQLSDFIVVKKKNGRTIETFMGGKGIIFKTNTGAVIDGQIKDIRNDSIFVMIYTIRLVPTNMGVNMLDTVSKYIFATNYRNISRIKVYHKAESSGGNLLGPLLILGGSGYILLNVINSVGHSEPLTEKRNLQSIGYAAGAIVLGYVVTKNFFRDSFSTKWHKFVYVNLN